MSYLPPGTTFDDPTTHKQFCGSQVYDTNKEVEDDVEAYIEYEEEKKELEAQSVVSPKGPCRPFRRRKDVVPDIKGGKGGQVTMRLDKNAKEQLVTEVMETTDMDNLVVMQKLKDRLAAIGMEQPAVEVRFSNITASRDVYTGSRSLPTLANAARGMAEGLLTPLMKLVGVKGDEKKHLIMLDNISGVLKPGRLTLLLGPPGAGKSTLLRVLSGQMKDKEVKLVGDVTFNGVPTKEFIVERTAAYIDQVDKHIAEMTVRETIAFSARMMGQGFGIDPVIPKVVEKEKEMGVTPDPKLAELTSHINDNKHGDSIMVDIIARLLGLDVCIDTVVGNDLLKGISGGQKKRVTTGEMVVGRVPCMFMDEISTGLDSASTFLITKALRNLCGFLRANIIIALLQPSPETYDVFDDILLMGDGRILYHGPREDVMPFFKSLGLTCPPRKAVADFLQEVTSKKEQPQYLIDKSSSFVSTQQVADAFKASPQGQARAAELAAPPAPTDLDLLRLQRKRYALRVWDMLKALMVREALLMKRMKTFVIARGMQTLLIAFMVSTTFVQLPKDNFTDANYYMSIAFFSLMYMLLGGFAEVPIFIQRLPVFYKQRDYKFYPAWAYCLSGAMIRLPDNLLMSTLWTVMVYWSVGFAASAGQFFIFYLLLLSMCIFSTATFRTLAAIARDETVAQAMGAVFLVLAINTCGFTLAMNSIPPWWIWVYWINPLAYAIRGLLVNEFNSEDWDTPVPTGPNTTTPLGIVALESRAFQTQTWWVWVGVGVMLGASMMFTAFQAFLLAFLDARKYGASAVEEEEEDVPQGTFKPPSAVATVSAPTGDVEMGAVSASGVKPVVKTSLAFTPFTLAFRNIKYHVPKPGGKVGEELTLLKGIDGCFRPSVLTALMGASGAGKTTLMDVLAGRKTGGRCEGEMLLNGHPKVQATFARVMGYVEQFDIHSPQATVIEALQFSGRMRLPESMDANAVGKFVHEVMNLVELAPLAHSVIGMPGISGLSVEQRKRLTIAVELVANPSVVFMDEPTSGLDARAAAIVMRTVRNTVNTGRTVVCTIHQPSLDIFQAFDELLLLKRGGETIFFGEMGLDQVHLINHFEAVEGVVKFVPGYNPANWMLDVTSPGAEKALGADFAAYYRSSPLQAKNKELLDKVCVPEPGSQTLMFDSPYAIPKFAQFRTLLGKNLVTYWRSPNYNLVRMMITLFVGLVFGSLYWDIGTDRTTVVGVLNIMGALYSSATFMGVANAMTVMPVINNERVVYYRERAAGMYHPLPFALAQGLVELPYLFVQTVAYSLLIYWMVGFQADAAKFFWFFFFLFLNFCALTFFGIMAINLTPAVQFGTVFVAFFFTSWNLFCGFLQAPPDIPGWWIWMHYLAPLSYTLYGLCASQLGDVWFEYINVAGPGQPVELVSVAQYVEDTFGYKHNMLGYLVLILFGFIVTFRLTALAALFKLNFQKR